MRASSTWETHIHCRLNIITILNLHVWIAALYKTGRQSSRSGGMKKPGDIFFLQQFAAEPAGKKRRKGSKNPERHISKELRRNSARDIRVRS